MGGGEGGELKRNINKLEPNLINWTSSFLFEGLVFFFLQILIEHIASKHWRPYQDAVLCGV